MIALLIVILLVCVAALALIVVAIRNLASYKWMTKDDYSRLNDEAKRIYKQRQEEKHLKPKRRGFFKGLSDGLGSPSSLPGPIRRAMGHPF